MRNIKVSLSVTVTEAEWHMLKHIATELGYYEDHSTDMSAVKALLRFEGSSALEFSRDELRALWSQPQREPDDLPSLSL